MAKKQFTEGRLDSLALEVAGGGTAKAWADRHGIPLRTVRHWTSKAEFRDLVRSHRSKLIDRAVGKLTRHVGMAVQGIAKLASGGESESVRLQACRAILQDLIQVQSHAELAGRIAELEKAVSKGR